MKLCDHPLRACSGPGNMQTEYDKESKYVPSQVLDAIDRGKGGVLSRCYVVRCEMEDLLVVLNSVSITISLQF